ncbi:alpha/beta hydrolase [Microbacteriaceae bacterium VKM Ac-2854]|nr:alpha/beta hydrolase [Microbacteriaceae bacterium VKM Ac-2854]
MDDSDYAATVTDARDISLPDGRIVRVHDSGPSRSDRLTVLWHHGSPQTGALLEPVLNACLERRIRLLSYGRPSYGGSTPNPGRAVDAAAKDVESILDALELDRIATMGASGGGPHALACAALLPERIRSVVTLAGIAPFTDEPSWYEGMAAPGGLRAAADGRAARADFAETDEFDPSSFIPADYALLDGPWASLGEDANRASADGDDGLIDDDVAFTRPWGFDLSAIACPVLLIQGGADRVVPAGHVERLQRALPFAETWSRPDDGHISVLAALPDALDWMLATS